MPKILGVISRMLGLLRSLLLRSRLTSVAGIEVRIILLANPKLTYLDRRRAAIGRVAAEVFGGGISALMDKLTEFIPNSDERKAFGEQLFEEYMSGEKHIGFRTYGLQPSKPC
jgi:hypothetical protein